MKTAFLPGFIIILASALMMASTCQQPGTFTVSDLLALPPAEADLISPYGRAPQQFGQLRLPQGKGPHPVVILIHGGCWLSEYDLRHISPLAAAITELGFATWSLEYRRIGDPGGGWPGTFLDIADGVDHVRTLSENHALDIDQVLAIGHSAGGHLALWAAARDKLPEDSSLFRPDPLPVQGVIALAGVTDLGRLEFQKGCGDAAVRLMGGPPEKEPLRYAQGSPIELLPIHVPQILIQGDRDPVISLDGARAYHAAARAKGDSCRLVVLEGAGHYGLVIPSSPAWKAVRDALLSFALD